MSKRIPAIFLLLAITGCVGGALLPIWFLDLGSGYLSRAYLTMSSDRESLYHVAYTGNRSELAINELTPDGALIDTTVIEVAPNANLYDFSNAFLPTDNNGLYVINHDAKTFFFANLESKESWFGLDESFVDEGKNLYLYSRAQVLGDHLYGTGYFRDSRYFGETTACALLKVGPDGHTDYEIFRDRCLYELYSTGESILVKGRYNELAGELNGQEFITLYDRDLTPLSSFDVPYDSFFIRDVSSDQFLASSGDEIMMFDFQGHQLSTLNIPAYYRVFPDGESGYYMIRPRSSGGRGFLAVLDTLEISHLDAEGNSNWSKSLPIQTSFFQYPRAKVNHRGELELSVYGRRQDLVGGNLDLDAFDDNTEFNVDFDVLVRQKTLTSHNKFDRQGNHLVSVEEEPWVIEGVFGCENYTVCDDENASYEPGNSRIFNAIYPEDGGVITANFHCETNWQSCTHRINRY